MQGGQAGHLWCLHHLGLAFITLSCLFFCPVSVLKFIRTKKKTPAAAIRVWWRWAELSPQWTVNNLRLWFTPVCPDAALSHSFSDRGKSTCYLWIYVREGDECFCHTYCYFRCLLTAKRNCQRSIHTKKKKMCFTVLWVHVKGTVSLYWQLFIDSSSQLSFLSAVFVAESSRISYNRQLCSAGQCFDAGFVAPAEFMKMFSLGRASASSSIKTHSVISITAAIYQPYLYACIF